MKWEEKALFFFLIIGLLAVIVAGFCWELSPANDKNTSYFVWNGFYPDPMYEDNMSLIAKWIIYIVTGISVIIYFGGLGFVCFEKVSKCLKREVRE